MHLEDCFNIQYYLIYSFHTKTMLAKVYFKNPVLHLQHARSFDSVVVVLSAHVHIFWVAYEHTKQEE